MFLRRKRWTSFVRLAAVVFTWIVFGGIVLAHPWFSHAQGSGHPDKGPNPDEPAIRDYVLSMDKVRKYAEVSKKLEAAAKSDHALEAEVKKIEEADVYNVDKIAMMEKSPHVAAALKSHDITAHDFVLTPLTTFTAAIGIAAEDAKREPPAFINPENIKFVREHKAELEKLNLFEPALDKSSPDKSKETKEEKEDKPDDQ